MELKRELKLLTIVRYFQTSSEFGIRLAHDEFTAELWRRGRVLSNAIYKSDQRTLLFDQSNRKNKLNSK